MLSRTADHLFWMARYMERAENTARMLDVNYEASLLPQTADVSYPIEQVIERVTLTPTRAFKFPEKLGTLEPGVTADVTVLQDAGNITHIVQNGTFYKSPVAA